MDGTGNRYRSFANLGNVRICSIREQNGSFGSLHDNLQIDVVLPDNNCKKVEKYFLKSYLIWFGDCISPEWWTGEISICIVTGINCGPAPKKHPGALPVGVVGVEDEPVPQRWSINRSVASLTLAASHSHPLITAIVVWKFFCFWRKVSWMLYWSWMVRKKGSLESKTVSMAWIIGKSKVKIKGLKERAQG